MFPTTPVHVTVDKTSGALPHWTAWIAALAPLATVAVAIIAVIVAAKALGASRRSASNSAASVEKADAALRGSQRPILKVSDPNNDGTQLRVDNIGPGIAVSVLVRVASVVGPIAEDDDVPWYGIARTPFDYGPLGSGEHAVIELDVISGVMMPGAQLHVLSQSADVSDEMHWTEQHLRASVPYRTVTGIGDVPDRLGGFFKNDPTADPQ